MNNLRRKTVRCMRCTLMALLPMYAGISITAQEDVLQYVRPMMGTSLDGRIIPLAVAPFGMVQLGPDTNYGGSGYHYTNVHVHSFSHTHANGNGGGDLQDICMMPVTGSEWDSRAEFPGDIHSSYSHDEEQAMPGYYSLVLPDEKVRVELTATERCGLHRYTFPQGTEPRLTFDMKRGNASRATTLPERFCDTVLVSRIEIVDKQTIRGYRITDGWAPREHCYFYARFNKPFTLATLYDNRRRTESWDVLSRDVRAMLRFPASGGPLEVQVGISGVSLEGAQRNWQAEAEGHTFDQIRKATQEKWQKQLEMFQIADEDSPQKQMFYTCLYFAMLYPQLYSDVDGRYRSSDAQVYRTTTRYFAGVLGLWDIYRNHAPLIALLRPDVMSDLMLTFLQHYRHSGILPMWTIAGQENNCMTGYHAMPIIADAMAKGLVADSIAEPLFQAMVESANKDCFGYFDHDFRGARYYRKYHYVPFNHEAHSASKTMEYSYDDWCVAQAARMLGHETEYREFLDRGGWWKNLFDPETGFVNARDTLGQFRKPFNPFSPAPAYFASDFCEGNSWQYSFFVPQDPEALIRQMGGRQAFTERLDSLFTATAPGAQQRSFGHIGQYAHENEPVHHILYLYNYAGEPWKTQQRVSQVLYEDYRPTPDGLCGNDDTGQMSAWFIQSAMGFFTLQHGNDQYAIGTPLFRHLELRHAHGTLRILAPAASRECCYVKSLRVNGRKWKGWTISGKDLFDGDVTVEFEMSSRP